MKKLKSMFRLEFLLNNEFKSNCTFVMSLVAISLYVMNPIKTREMCMYAMLTSMIADLVLMDYNEWFSFVFKKYRLYVGMLLFMVAHVIYIVCFSSMLSNFSIDFSKFFLNILIYVLIAFGLISFSIAIAWKKSPLFRIATIVYTVVINIVLFTMFVCADVLGGRYILAAIGIMFFAISDICILIRETVCDNALVRKLIWIFYPIGQMFIICSI